MMVKSVLLFFAATLLAAVPANANFPRGRCSDGACTSSPYALRWQSMTENVGSGGGRFCFVVERQTCIQTQQRCCDMLADKLYKVVLSVNPTCNRRIANVTIDGVRKGGGVFFDLYGADEAELRITNMPYNITTGPGRVICINTMAPCGTLSAFCANPDGTAAGTCKFSIFDPLTHICCPTCNILARSIGGFQSPPPSPKILVSPPPPPKAVSPKPPSPLPPRLPFAPATPMAPGVFPPDPPTPDIPPAPPSPLPKQSPPSPPSPKQYVPPQTCTQQPNTCVCQCQCARSKM